ncbi:MAG TPA: SGNH/GDSL hydrolase family protein [Candidatus Binatia bacterium]|nr:SGNH/GDSL hydrolase family protein [Candidatus Binatia bacterium]
MRAIARASAAAALVTWVAACADAPSGSSASSKWVGTWSTSPMCFQAATILGLPQNARFDDESVRMIVRTSLAGDAVRVKLTNQCGSEPLAIGAATIGLRDARAGLRPDTVRVLTFGGSSATAIAAGATATSDPVDLVVPALADVAITLYLPEPTVPTTSHPLSATGWVATGDATADAAGAAFGRTTAHWVFLASVDVLAGRGDGAIVAFGDSITEGTGTTFDANRRWPDVLAERLVSAGMPRGVLNQGINGNKVLNSLLGESALLRFDEDALGQSGVEAVVLLEGINDIGLGRPDVTAEEVIAGYRDLIARAHARGLPIFGGTLTPAEGNTYPFYAPYDESKRAAINAFIRESGAFDAVIDFDAAVRDPANPTRWRRELSADLIHPTDAGAEALANAVDLSLFR